MEQRDEGAVNQNGSSLSLSSNLGAMAKAIQMVACGREHSMALTRGGSIWCWGDNQQGQLGLGMMNENDYSSSSSSTFTFVSIFNRKRASIVYMESTVV